MLRCIPDFFQLSNFLKYSFADALESAEVILLCFKRAKPICLPLAWIGVSVNVCPSALLMQGPSKGCVTLSHGLAEKLLRPHGSFWFKELPTEMSHRTKLTS